MPVSQHTYTNFQIMSSDVLTQLQTCYDQLLTQFFSTVSYLSLRHPLVAPEPIAGEPYTQPPKDESLHDENLTISSGSTRHRYTNMKVGEEDAAMGLQPVPPATFDRAQQDLAEDLIRKGQQIECLIRICQVSVEMKNSKPARFKSW